VLVFFVNVSAIEFFSDTRKLSSLPVEPLEEDTIKTFTARGRKFVKLAERQYLEYTGLMSRFASPAEAPPTFNDKRAVLHFDVSSLYVLKSADPRQLAG